MQSRFFYFKPAAILLLGGTSYGKRLDHAGSRGYLKRGCRQRNDRRCGSCRGVSRHFSASGAESYGAGLEWFVREVRLDITKLMSIASVCDGSRYSAYVPKNTARIFFPEKEGGTQHPASWVIPTGGGIPADIVDMLADWEDDEYEEFSDEDAADEARAREAESKAETADKEAGGSHEQRP